jgi:Holliday junction DNA helicase RuvA
MRCAAEYACRCCVPQAEDDGFSMIGFLKGRLAVKQPPMLLVDVNGVGYELEAPMSTFYGLPALGEAVALFTHLVVREDAHILYAFGTDGERRLFRGLLKVSGVGPKIALGILSGASVEDFLRTIEAEDVAMLTRIPGIGRKTAERVIIEMRDSVKKLSMPAANGGAAAVGATLTPTPQSEAFSALIALGYKPPEVVRLLKTVEEPGLSTTEMIRRALKSAAKA